MMCFIQPTMSEEWSQGELSVLIRYGSARSDQELYDSFLPHRTPSSIKHKRQRLGIYKRPAHYDRIATAEETKIPGVIDLSLAHSPTAEDVPVAGLTPEQERAQILMMFLSRLDEYPPETLDMIENALEIAHRGWALLHGE